MPCGVRTTKASSCSADRRYCYPLTITDFASRYLLRCEALSTTQERYAFTVFERVFKDFGLPARDPHRQRRALRLGARALRPEQARRSGGCAWAFRSSGSSPGHPEQNGRHERMHLTLKTEATKPAARQRAAAASALRCLRRSASTTSGRIRRSDMKVPGGPLRAVAAPLSRARRRSTIPFHDWTATVTHCGRICFKSRKMNLSQVFAGQQVGVKQVERPHLARHLHGLRSGLLRR